MLRRIPGLPDRIAAFDAVGRISADDYAATVEPLLTEAEGEGRRLRILVRMGPEYEGFTAGAVWGKAEAWMRHPRLWRSIEGYALVSDIGWVDEFAHLASFLVSFPMRVFGLDGFDEAVTWLAELPHTAGATHDEGPAPAAAP
ncbi:STAS/SEC14 domain-containing protein [Actinomycetospora straminea]|uniref:SpoIIAA-like protein n=1 Tax=Actinomycetospora straminea TaxID=663607 RepID=A0ABP9EK60_9PSEU|nr:STAS/SEC14 domain-containing protein [Actinomycetospora straminea]MDD7933174.1 STAS/SEC14 domain-containing protein [Actinomycetospora straminea]